MACCAFALLLLSHVLAPFRAVVRLLRPALAWQPDASVAWSPHLSPVQPARRSRRPWPAIAILAAADLAILALPAGTSLSPWSIGGSPAAKSPPGASADLEALIHASVCGRIASSRAPR